MNIHEMKESLRARLELALGDRIGFDLDEAARIMRLSRKTLYNSKIGFPCAGRRLVGVDDILSHVSPVKQGE